MSKMNKHANYLTRLIYLSSGYCSILLHSLQFAANFLTALHLLLNKFRKYMKNTHGNISCHRCFALALDTAVFHRHTFAAVALKKLNAHINVSLPCSRALVLDAAVL